MLECVYWEHDLEEIHNKFIGLEKTINKMKEGFDFNVFETLEENFHYKTSLTNAARISNFHIVATLYDESKSLAEKIYKKLNNKEAIYESEMITAKVNMADTLHYMIKDLLLKKQMLKYDLKIVRSNQFKIDFMSKEEINSFFDKAKAWLKEADKFIASLPAKRKEIESKADDIDKIIGRRIFKQDGLDEAYE